MAEMSDELRTRFAASDDPSHREAVIVTLEPGADVDLAALGLDAPTRLRRDGSVLSGVIDAGALGALLAAPGVRRIDHDGEMHALDDDRRA